MTQSSRAYVLVPIIYLGVIFGLLFLQFSGGERFSRSVGPLSLQATRGVASDDGTPTIRELGLSFDGLHFQFGEGSGLIVETTSNVSDMEIVGYSTNDDGFELRFDNDYRLSFVVTTDPARELQLRLELPEEREGVREISIPFGFDGVPTDDQSERSSFITVASEGQDYYFTTPPNAEIDLANRKIVVRPEAADQAIRYVVATEGDPTRVVRWFDDESLTVGDTEYAATIDAWIDRAYLGWSDGRYNSTRLTWDGPGGFASFGELALTAYLAEAWSRDEYERAFAEMRRASDLHPEELSLLSAPFLGNLDEIREQTLGEDRIRAETIAEQLDSGDTTIFRQDGLFPFAANRGGEELYTRLIEFTAGVDLRALDLVSAIGLLRNLFLEPLPDDRAESLSLRAVDLIQIQLLGSIVRTEAGFFVQTSPGQIDLYQTAVAGAVLEAFGASRNDRTMSTIGRNLVVSVLGQADPNAMVPSTLLVRGETVETADGAVTPERLYPLLTETRSYPHLVSLYEEAGSGHWIWTNVTASPVRIAESEWRFALSYPRLRTHYVLLQGIPEFTRMELFGQTWRDAPDFEIYSKGRHYDEQTNTLMIKYYDDSTSREIVLFY
ncbi:MAG: hypothetical protein ACOC2Q_03175 [Spirochaetota bacterium]